MTSRSEARRIFRSNSILRDVGKGDEFHCNVLELCVEGLHLVPEIHGAARGPPASKDYGLGGQAFANWVLLI